MKFKNIDHVNEFLSVVDSCASNVYLTSQQGDRFNLKSKLSQYIAIGALLGKDGDSLEIWCDSKDDESKIIKFLSEHPEI